MMNFENWNSNQSLQISVPFNSRFEVCSYLSKSVDSDNTNIIIDICQLGRENHPRFLICTVSLLNANRTPCKSKTSQYLFIPFNANQKWTFPTFLTKDKILKEKARYLKDGVLTLQFEFSISNGKLIHFPVNISKPSQKHVTNETVVDTLRDDLRRMYLEEKFTDVVLKAGEDIFKAHKAILSVRSPVFKAMFDQDMAENNSGNVDIPDLEGSTLNSLMVFMYSGVLEDWDYDSISKLLVAADKYQLLELREKCVVVLKSILSIENVCQVLILANFQADNDLNGAALDYICANSLTVLQSNEWQCFIESNRKLSSEVLYRLSVDALQSR